MKFFFLQAKIEEFHKKKSPWPLDYKFEAIFHRINLYHVVENGNRLS